jgi:hypothetical protein
MSFGQNLSSECGKATNHPIGPHGVGEPTFSPAILNGGSLNSWANALSGPIKESQSPVFMRQTGLQPYESLTPERAIILFFGEHSPPHFSP